MRFEKLSENKLRIIVSMKDLEEKDIDFHDFMSNSLETQDLFLDILEEAEEKVGFHTKNYRVKIEALAMTDMDFIVTITRMVPPEAEKNVPTHKKFKVRRKQVQTEATKAIYRFSSFDDYCYFIQYVSQNHLSTAFNIAKHISLYLYKEQYYLILMNIHPEYPHLKKFLSSIVEFATYINPSTLFLAKLQECGSLVIKHNAFRTSLKHFSTKNKKDAMN